MYFFYVWIKNFNLYLNVITKVLHGQKVNCHIAHVLQNFRDARTRENINCRVEINYLATQFFRFYLRTWHRTWLAKFVNLYLVLFHVSPYVLKSWPVGRGSQVAANKKLDGEKKKKRKGRYKLRGILDEYRNAHNIEAKICMLRIVRVIVD